jgi:hypothetical protein
MDDYKIYGQLVLNKNCENGYYKIDNNVIMYNSINNTYEIYKNSGILNNKDLEQFYNQVIFPSDQSYSNSTSYPHEIILITYNINGCVLYQLYFKSNVIYSSVEDSSIFECKQ